MEQPEGFVVKGKKDFVCRLKKSLYGLKQAPRVFVGRFYLQRVLCAVSSLMYAMVCMRPNIAHAVGVVSFFLSNPGKEH